MRFTDRVAVVTGGSSGIGARLVARFAEEGARVYSLDVSALEEPRGDVVALTADVSDPAAVADAFARIREEAGGADILVNNAAIAVADGLDGIDDASWRREIAVALDGTFHCCRAALPAMTARGRGAIVNLGSVNGLAAYGQEPYSAAKAGIESLTRNLAVRYGPRGVRANCVAPGTVATSAWRSRVERDPGVFDELAAWYPLGRVGTPDDVAPAVLFLASDDAAWITGTTLVVDGGLTAGGFRMIPAAVGREDS